jgi:hypothetical protein
LSKANIKFENADSNNRITFLPFGVTSIEFTMTGKFNAGFLRPKNSVIGGEQREFVGFADASKDFLVIWGGGIGRGQPLNGTTKDRMFFQLINTKDTCESTPLTFIHDGQFGWETKVELVRPNVSDIVHGVWDENNNTLSFHGNNLPIYYSRWFPVRPPETLQYLSLEYPAIKVQVKKVNNEIVAPVEISIASDNGANKKIAVINGDIACSNIHAELFSFIPEKKIYVLRLWVYWINKRFDEGFFNAEIESMNNTEYLGNIQNSIDEIPDIERFDFVIDGEKKQIIFFATDFHYQEYWGAIDSSVVDAKIADIADILLVSIGNCSIKLSQKSKYYNPVPWVKQIISSKQKQAETTAIKPIMQPSQERFLGKILNHVPYVTIGTTSKELISSDCRKTE